MLKIFTSLRKKTNAPPPSPAQPEATSPTPAAEDVALTPLPTPPHPPERPQAAAAQPLEAAQAEADRRIDAGNELEDRGDTDTALAHYQQALQIMPDYWRAHLNLGNAYKIKELWDSAFSHYQDAYRLNPRSPGACYNMGLDLVRQLKPTEAIRFLEEAIQLKPNFSDAMAVLAEALELAGRLEEGLSWLNKALALDPDNTGLVFNKLKFLEQLERYEEGEETALRLITLPEGRRHGYNFLAEFAKRFGEIKKSIDYYHQVPIQEYTPGMYSNYLLALSYDAEMDPIATLAEHKAYRQFIGDVTHFTLPPITKSKPQRIGFISADLRAHPVANFIAGLFPRLDRSKFEVYAYYAHPMDDAITGELRKDVDRWRNIHRLQSRAAADLIVSDRIDILIDLSGHTGGNRMDVLALKPAPVIATWLGYLGTTGLDEVDFRIVDPYTDPEGMTQAHHTEQLVRLAHSQWCYMPRADHPPVRPLPALTNGHITFGSFNNFPKICDQALILWAQLLARISGSRLLIAAIPPGRSRQRVADFFLQQGVSAERLEFIGRTSFIEYMQNYGRIDVALDSFPYNGGTTTCNALYMGVPVLTLAGQHSVARSGLSLMTNVGLPNWVAHSPPEFLEIGVCLTANLTELAQLRAGLRERLMNSPVGNQNIFARDFESALEAMWQCGNVAEKRLRKY
jgi:predicted O-linked N-acetylglucosamine transferase (SPINDLY family)